VTTVRSASITGFALCPRPGATLHTRPRSDSAPGRRASPPATHSPPARCANAGRPASPRTRPDTAATRSLGIAGRRPRSVRLKFGFRPAAPALSATGPSQPRRGRGCPARSDGAPSAISKSLTLSARSIASATTAVTARPFHFVGRRRRFFPGAPSASFETQPPPRSDRFSHASSSATPVHDVAGADRFVSTRRSAPHRPGRQGKARRKGPDELAEPGVAKAALDAVAV